ncbi:ATP-dependent helicase [Candidatus Pacearchaeota archaeon]|nr:ATP-dependent helicase [Candidatus Pacearchaeota archaeon]
MLEEISAIKKVKGPCVILAGAGTGKTHTIVEKVKYIIENKIYSPEKIVCITFSNEAANNLSSRISRILGKIENSPIIRTFHGFSADLLRIYGVKIGIKNNFKILDPDEAKVILHRNLRIAPGNCHKYISNIGIAKDLGIGINDLRNYLLSKEREFLGINLEKKLEILQFELQTLYLKYNSGKRKILLGEIKKVKRIIELKKFLNAWGAYEKIKQKGNFQDYSDLNMNALEIVKRNQEIKDDFEYFIVDEFQDTNKMQLDFLIELSREGNISIVGDLNQSIYRFRGAYKENINLFKKAFNVIDSDIFTLSKSYRSSNKILKLAHKLILNNYKNKKECFFIENFENREGEKIEIFEIKDSREEARKIIELINNELKRGTPLDEICIMFRTHQYGRIIRKALEREGIEYVAVAKSSLLRQKSVKTAHDFLIILNKIKRSEKGGGEIWWDIFFNLEFNKDDLIILGKEINSYSKKGSGQKIDKVGLENKEPISLYLFQNLDKLEFSEGGKKFVKIIIDKIKEMLSYIDKRISDLLTEIYRIGGFVNEQKTKHEKEIMLNLNKFYELAKSHESLYDSDLNNFIYYLEVLESLGIEIEASTLEEEGVRLMTSHATKGLEFSIVIVTNLAQGRFPLEKYSTESLIPTELLPDIKSEIKNLSDSEKEDFIMNYERNNHLLEERRLAYVSFTRAKEKLILTFAEQYGHKKTFPSQFLDEIRYRDNDDVSYVKDDEIKFPSDEHLIDKKQIDIPHILSLPNFEKALGIIVENKGIKKTGHERFSPSALIMFSECEKSFEYKYIYNMPEKKTISWEAMRLGSFVHIILEKGVSLGFKSLDEFLSLTREIGIEEDWENIELKEAEILIKVFFERNKGHYNSDSKTEQYLPLKLEGMDFIGFADRIDFTPEGAEIVDYKTGRQHIASKNRNWQLGFYALAAEENYGKVSKVILDMLKQERPLEFKIDGKGYATCVSSRFIDGFNIYDVKRELIETAYKIQEAYKKGFKPCPIEKNCEFCNEYVYGL